MIAVVHVPNTVDFCQGGVAGRTGGKEHFWIEVGSVKDEFRSSEGTVFKGALIDAKVTPEEK